MKKALFIIILLILASCGKPEKSEAQKLADQLREDAEEPIAQPTLPVETVKPVEPTPEAKSVEPIATPAPTIAPVEAAPVEETVAPPKQRTAIYEFLDTFAQKVTSYQFTYKEDKYFVKGNKYKIQLFRAVSQKSVSFGEVKKSLFYYDTVYVDRATKKAVAYCEGHQSNVNTQCAQLEIFDLAYPVEFKEFNITLPEDWLLSYLDFEPTKIEKDKYYVNQKSVVRAVYEGGNTTTELNFDPVTGLVVRADLIQADKLGRYDYKELAANAVRDVDVLHRSKEDIPSSETFNSRIS